MKAVFLDSDTVGLVDVDLSPVQLLLPDLRCFPTTKSSEVAGRIGDAEVVIVNKAVLDAEAMERADRLRLVCLAATGTDNIDLAAASARGIAVTNIRDYCTPSVAQHVFALILSLTHHIVEYRALLAAGGWHQHSQFCMLDFPIRELAGKTLGIVGLGALGSGVARVAKAFGMTVIAARRPYRFTGPSSELLAVEAHGVTRVDWPHLLTESDVVSLHCPLNPETRHLIDREALQTMRPDALLINTARGGLVNAADLVAALADGIIAGAGIDVLEREPPVAGDPLLDYRAANLIVTPHVAWAARESRQRAIDEIAANVAAFLKGDRRNRIDG